MKHVKCYGRAKIHTLDSSFKRKFFGSFDSRKSGGINSFQEFQQNGSSSFTSVASTSDNTSNHSFQLFASDNDLYDKSLSSNSTCSLKNVRAKHKSVKHSVKSKTYKLKKFSFTSVSDSSLDLQPVLSNNAKKPLKKYKRTSKSFAKHRAAKKNKPSAERTASYSLKLSYSKGRSKKAKHVKLYKKGVLKRNCNSKRRTLNKHSSIPIQRSCSEFCENPSSVIKTCRKKLNKKGGKRKQPINKDNEVAISNHFSRGISPSIGSKSDSFWCAIQPNWASICEHSFKMEKVSKDRNTVPVFIEHQKVCSYKNAAFPDLIDGDYESFSIERSISGGIPVEGEEFSCSELPPAIEKYKSTGESNAVRNEISKKSNNLNTDSSETVDNKLKTDKNISVKVTDFKKSDGGTCTDSINVQMFQEGENIEIQHKSDDLPPVVSNLCETVSEKFNANEIVAISTDEKASEVARKERTKGKKSNEDVINSPQTNISSSIIVPKDKNGFKTSKEDEYLSKRADQLPEYAFAKPLIKGKGFYSSTPFASPTIHATVAKNVSSTVTFNPLFQKGLFTTSTPAHTAKTTSAQQNQICNVSRISRLGKQYSSLQDLSIDSSVKLRKYPSTKINSSALSGKNKSHVSFTSSRPHGNQNTHHTSRSCSSILRREQKVLGESHHCSKSWSLISEASSGAGPSSVNNLESPLSKLLELCGQKSVIPFGRLYNWRHTTFRKIGEGTYGEVFTLVQNKISSVIKVIPFSEGGDQNMQSIESVLSEVTVAKCLSELRNHKTYQTRNFNKLKSVHLVRGSYPYQMTAAWDDFHDTKTTYNDRPADVYNNQQKFAIIELEFGGKDMSCFIMRNAVEAESILTQIAISLAIAEEVHLFEHRDLHLGNILVQRNNSKTISYVLRGRPFSIPSHGVVVTIIDFTLSRVLHEGCIYYNDLADDSIFNQTGDYQFQIYKDTKALLNNEWHKSLLYSNVLWLMYLCVKLTESDYSRPTSKMHAEGLNRIRSFQNNLQNCENAYDCLIACNIYPSAPRSNRGSGIFDVKARLVDRKSLQKSSLSRN